MNRKAILVAALCFGACKTEKVEVPDQKTVGDLNTCKTTLGEKQKVIDELKNTNGQLILKQGAGSGSGAGEVLVTIQPEGNQCKLVVTPPKVGEYYAENPKVLEQRAAEVFKFVNMSRGEIQKCYEQALKKNSGLQSKEQTVYINATFGNGGIQGSPSFDPSLGGVFDSCMTAIVMKWKPTAAGPVRAPVSLKPS
jgi:hypothetical protein